jgi:hypothetical protein
MTNDFYVYSHPSIYTLKNMIGKAIFIYIIWLIFKRIPLFYRHICLENFDIDVATLIAIYLAICIFVAGCFYNERTISFHNMQLAYAEAASNDQHIPRSGGHSYQNIARIWYSRADGWLARGIRNCISFKYCLMSGLFASLALIGYVLIYFVRYNNYGLCFFYFILLFLIIAYINTRTKIEFFRKFKKINKFLLNCCEPLELKNNFTKYIKNESNAPEWINKEFEYDSYWDNKSVTLPDRCDLENESGQGQQK